MADLATAYVRIIPSLKGVQKTIKSELDGVDTSPSGKKMGGKLADGMKSGLSTAKVAVGNIIADMAVSAATAAAGAIKNVVVDAFDFSAQYEQLAGGAKKIFNEIDFNRISADAQNAYKELNMSANEYLESINQVGATFAQTMGDEKGYQVARDGMLAISDYATGTGKNIELLNEKYQMISRSASSYQSIADQFAGILPQTSNDFLAQAQAAGLLSNEYKSLTDVPVAEYQQALTAMLTQGVADLGLAQNTLHESTQTISGAIAMTQSVWQNFLTVLGDPEGNVSAAVTNLVDAASVAAQLIIPKITEIMSNLAIAIPQLVDQLLPVLAEHSTELINSLSEVIAALVPVLLEAAVILFAAILTALVKAMPQILENMGQLVLNLVEAIALGLRPMMDAMEDNMNGVLESIGAFFVGLFNAGCELVWSIVNGIAETGGNIISFFASILDSAYQTVANYASWLYNAGVELVNGLVRGISENFWAVINTVAGGIQSVINYVTSALGIASPSKVFAGIGEYTMQGFADGIEGASGEAEKAMQHAMSDVYGAANGVASVSMRAEATGAGSMASEVASLREELRQMRLVLNIDGRAFAQATVGEMDRALNDRSNRILAGGIA